MISRIFFPIGQGAFYAERHDTFNVVYDCGNWKQTSSSKDVVIQSFTKNESIKILFISHLNWDHISLIETLKDTVKSIDYVILPLLHDEQKILISNIHRALGYSSDSIINTPDNFFGENAKIINIIPSDRDEISDTIINIDDESEIKNAGKISSGTIINIKRENYNWCFIPFNIENKKRSKILEDELIKEGFDVNELKKDSSYALNRLTTKDKITLKKSIIHYKVR